MNLPLDYGNPGDRIPVLLDNGQIKILTAGNVVNSSEIQVHGDYVFSAGSPRTETIDRQIFKKRPREKEVTSCQLVAASIWRGISEFIPGGTGSVSTIVSTHPLTAPYRLLVTDPIPGWRWVYIPPSSTSGGYSLDSTKNICVMRPPEPGQTYYDSAEECIVANQGILSPMHQKTISSFGSGSNNIGIDYNHSHGATETAQSLARGDRFRYSNSGNFVDYPASEFNNPNPPGGLLGFNRYGLANFGLSIKAGFENDIWVISSQGAKTLFDGSIKLNGSSLSGGILVEPGQYLVPLASGVNYELKANLGVVFGSISNNFSLQTSYIFWRGVEAVYPSTAAIDSVFLKVHDPDLPVIKVADLPFNTYNFDDMSFSFLGDKAYLFYRYGLAEQFDIPVNQRPFYGIKVFKFEITSDQIVQTESDFLYPDTVVIDSKVPFANRASSYLQSIPNVDDSCLDIDTFRLMTSEFREVHYQNTNRGLIEFKTPGQVFGQD